MILQVETSRNSHILHAGGALMRVACIVKQSVVLHVCAFLAHVRLSSKIEPADCNANRASSAARVLAKCRAKTALRFGPSAGFLMQSARDPECFR